MARGSINVGGKNYDSHLVSTSFLYTEWTGTTAPYTYTLTISGITNTSNQEVLPSLSITQTELSALQSANIQDGGQSTDTMIILAWGSKPTIDIPIRVILRGDI